MGSMRVDDEWIWVDSKKKIDFPLIWHEGQQDNHNDDENCLTVKQNEPGNIRFDDISCTSTLEENAIHALCQKWL